MALWSDVVIGFDGEEETVNFGTRIVSENSNGIFETYTLATVQPKTKVLDNPHVLAASFPSGHVCVAADKSFITFADETCSHISFVYNFQYVIDCFCASDDGLVYFVVTGKEVHCLYHSTRDQLLNSRLELPLVNSNDFRLIKIFVHAVQDHVYDVFMIGNKGHIFRICGLDLRSLKEEIVSDVYDFSKHFKEIKIEVARKPDWKCEITSADITFDSGTVKLVLVGSEMILWSQELCESWIQETPLPKIKSVACIENSSLMLCLSEDGRLLTACSETLIFLSFWNEMAVEDFAVLGRISAEDIASVLVLTKSDDCGKRQIQLVSFPGMEKKFSIHVSSAAFLVSKLPAAQELLFLEGTGNSTSEFIQMLYVKNIVRSQPIDRLQRLLRRYKFDDAETFAVRFNLDVELVYKEHAKQCMELMQPWASSSSDKSHFYKFINLLNKIKDLEFICEACLNALTVDFSKTQMLLDYARDQLKKDDNKGSRSSKISSLQSSLWNMSNRLNTFLFVYKSNPDSVEWCRFSNANLIDVCKQHLQRGEIHQAALIWSRHWHSFNHLLTDEKLRDLFDAISPEVRAPDMLPWLRHFIPFLLGVPESLQYTVKGIIKAIRSLEIEKENWPNSGLSFAEEVLDIMKVKTYSQLEICLSSYKQQTVISTHLKELVAVANALKELQQLKENYKIRISLADFTQSNKKEVVMILLRKVAPMNLQQLMTDFLSKYMLNNGLVRHNVLSECVHNILSQSANWWYYNTQAPWEETICAIIPCIMNVEDQINCIISALKMAPLPWSDIICETANKGLMLDHPSVKHIRHEYKMMKIKMVQKKYGFTKLSVEKCNLYNFISLIKLILKKGKEEMLEDALKLASISTNMTEETYILYLEHLIELGNGEKALKLLDSLKPQLIIKCCQRISLRAQSFLESKLNFKVNDHYFEILSSLELRLKKAHDLIDGTSINITELPIQEMRNIYLLRKEFGKTVSLKEICNIDSCKEIMSECVEELINSQDVCDVYCKVGNLCKMLQLSLQEGVLEMIKHALSYQNLSLVSSIMRDFLHCDSLSESCSEKLRIMICQFLEASCNISHRHGGPQLAYDITREVCTNCMPESLPSWVELLQWIYTVKKLTALEDDDGIDEFKTLAIMPQDSLTTWRFTPLYKDPAIFSNSVNVLSFLKEVCHQYLNSRTLPNVKHIIEQLELVAGHLQNQHCDVGAMRLWCCVTAWALLIPSSKETNRLLSVIEIIAVDSAKALLHNIVSSRTLDVTLGVALLLSLGERFAEGWLQESMAAYKQDHRKLGATVQLGMLCSYSSLKSEYYEVVNMKCAWAKRLARFKVHYNVFIETPDQKLSLLKSLMKLKEVDISLILEYCSDFDLDIQESLILYLKTILLSWEPKFEIEKTIDGEEKLIVHDMDSETEKKCKNIIALITNKTTLAIELDDILGKINYYNYEMYIYLISLLENCSPKHNFINKKLLLTFLKNYKRNQAPKQEELDNWLKNFPCSFHLPVCSKWRLPFSLFMNDREILGILKQELNMNTYKEWCSVLDVFRIDRDNTCSIAIRESFTIKDESIEGTWNVISQDALFLNQVEECVSSISDPEKASACTYYVMNRMPPGADQVTAAELCYKYILKWYENDKTRAKEHLMFVERKYLHLRTVHILHKYDLAENCYLKLVADPQQLMSTLLQHPSIISKGKGTTVYCPDINAAVEEIAEVHKINSIKFRYNKLEKWLQPYAGIQQSQSDDTCDLTKLVCLPSNVIAADEDNLLRASYILKCSDEKIFTNYLVKIALKLETSCEISMALRLRALQCLTVITSEVGLEELTGLKTETTRQMLKNLTFSSHLEMLGLNCSLSYFISCNKIELIKGIWKMQSNNPQALTLIAGLCVEYGVQQKVIWEALLKQMVKFFMVKDLEVLLLHVDELGYILSDSLYVQIWESVLLAPFVRGEQEEECIHSLVLFQRCPILHSINLSDIVEYSLQMQRPHLAAVILPFLKETERNALKQKIVRFKDRTEIKQNLKQLVRKGVLIAEEAIPFVLSEESIHLNGHVDL